MPGRASPKADPTCKNNPDPTNRQKSRLFGNDARAESDGGCFIELVHREEMLTLENSPRRALHCSPALTSHLAARSSCFGTYRLFQFAGD